MFEILRQSLKTGVVTTSYPKTPPEVSSFARGKPEIDWANWKDARPAAAICPTSAIWYEDLNGQRVARLDLAKCIFCGLCADVDPGIRMTNLCECAACRRDDLLTGASYHLNADGTHDHLLSPPSVRTPQPNEISPAQRESLDAMLRCVKTPSGVGLAATLPSFPRRSPAAPAARLTTPAARSAMAIHPRGLCLRWPV